jgi:hypothetical protein
LAALILRLGGENFFLGHLYEWYLGAFLAHQFLRAERNSHTMQILAGLAALLGIGRWIMPGVDTISTSDMVFATVFAIFLFWAIQKEQDITLNTKGLISTVFAFLVYMGERSYSLYVMITAPWVATSYSNALLVALFASMVSIITGLVAFDLVERHFLVSPARNEMITRLRVRRALAL